MHEKNDMKKILFLALIALSTAANAQTEKEVAAAAKQAAKELKAKKAADLKAFKENQKAALAEFIAKQNAPVKEATEMSKEDSVAQFFGISQSRGLKNYLAMQMGVDTAYINDFAQGVIDNVNIDLTDPTKKAYNAGQQIAGQIVNMTQSFSKDYFAADPDKSMSASVVASALIDGLLGTSKITQEEAGAQLEQIMRARQEENKERMYGPNRDAGEKFLAENKNKDGVVTLPSGLQYKVITQGTGDIPTSKDKVKVNYEGKLIDGTVFDSSYKRNQPASFGVTQVIKGWTEALQLMPVGSKWELYIPYQLAYGDRETGKEIKPYSALTFVVELLDIETKETPKAEAPKADTKAAAKKSAKKK